MTPTPYNIVREACVKANHDIVNEYSVRQATPNGTKIEKGRATRLADVLLALGHVGGWGFAGVYEEECCLILEDLSDTTEARFKKWNLLRSLEWHRDNQPETVAWLASLLTSN